ncbi:class I SAM-dependent methyltransferase [Prauserella oleivorans]|uniref:Methyltransferase n=2 Tax=Prauserella TaxID=142577 RepID=A0A318LF77_9PSEU|nr:class I SAM-dependent methyltransferase [Prauserella flavalba]PXY25540.1 methyltransferase [Prauserella flavalba]
MDSTAWDRRYTGAEFEWTTEPNRFVVEQTTGLTPGRALDLGTGEGRNAVWLAEQGWTVSGVDFSTVGLDKARRLAHARDVRVDWTLADVRDYQPEPSAFALVLVAYLHLPSAELPRVLDRAASAVATKGTLLVIGHDLTNLTAGVGGPPDPDVLYTPEGIVAALPALRIERAERLRRPLQQGEAIDTLVRATRT